MFFSSPCFLRPNQGKVLTKIFRPCMPWRQPPPPLTAPPSRLIQSIPQQTLHNKHLSDFPSIHTASTSISRLGDKDATSNGVYGLSLKLSQRPMNGNASMQYTLYNSEGIASLVGQPITKLEIADKYCLSTRDLRVFDLPFGWSPHILVREDTVLIHLFDLRLLVQHDRVLLFHVAEFHNANFEHEHGGPRGDKSIGNGDNHSVSRVFSHNLELKLHGQRGLSARQPYELRVIEAALVSVTSVLEAEYLLISQQVLNTLHLNNLDEALDKEESLIHAELRTMLDLTRQLASIEQRAQQMRYLTQEVLNEDEDMANMYLTDKRAGKPHVAQDHQDVEYLFETYFKASDAVVQEAASLMGNIRRTEETIQSTLRVRRNQIMVLEARIEILMLAVAGTTLVAGWYGMNVNNYFEESAHAFAGIVMVSFTAIISASWYGMRKLRYIRRLRL